MGNFDGIEDPVITAAERFGYYHKPKEPPRCPWCYDTTWHTLYICDAENRIIGCDRCIRGVDRWDYDMEADEVEYL